MISGLIEGNYWISDSMEKYDIEDLRKIDDMAPEHQMQQWNKETVRNHDLKPETKNFEDIYGDYSIFDNDLSITSPYSDEEACHKTQ